MSDIQPQPEPTGEPIHYQGRLHWTIFVRPVMLTCLALLLFNTDNVLIGALFALAAALFWLAALLAFRSAALLITDRRVRLSSGTIYRVSVDLPLSEIDRISVRQDFMGRLLGYGTLLVESTNGTRVSCPNLTRPAEFERRLAGVTGLG
jgi:uncharacterized membrane protein YdbT with pleckstrin-like domain